MNKRMTVRTTVAAVVTAATYIAAFATPAYAINDANTVITNVQTWVTGILAALATLFLSVGGIRYMMAAGNRREMERGKEAMKTAIFGYVLAALAPVLLGVLRTIVGT